MTYIDKMATFPRHGHLVSAFFANVFDKFKRKELYCLQEQHLLVIWGKKFTGYENLVDINNIDDIKDFKDNIIEELDIIQPDFLLFKDNKFIQSNNTLRTAGVPDLVIEVWSKGNLEAEREMKFKIYSSHEDCEHWYLDQYSNTVKCWLGKKSLQDQNLNQILYTQKNLEFDLRFLAL